MNTKKVKSPWSLWIALMLIVSCSDDAIESDDFISNNSALVTDVKTTYANIALANYTDALTDAKALKTAIDAFVADPTEEGFEAVQDAWLTARESYGPTEAFRFANGPIDSGDTGEIEGLLNAWPLDEAFVDYVEVEGTILNGGIINDDTIELTKEKLVSKNGEGETEENVSVGYHAIEFLLWGQDLTDPAEDLPGQRPFTDFVDEGTAENQDRRGQYLTLVAALLVEHLQTIVDEWEGSFRSTFLASDDEDALRNMISSIAELAGGELAGERMATALESANQEDEHSCFSDNTHRDIRLNLQGIKNIYKGVYEYNNIVKVEGSSLEDLMEKADPELAEDLDNLLSDAETKVEATGIPFDLAIKNGIASPEGQKVGEAITALRALSDNLSQAQSTLGLPNE